MYDDDDEGGSMTAANQPLSAVPLTAAVGGKDLAPSTVSLSGLLNAIDGVSSQVDDNPSLSCAYDELKLHSGRLRPRCVNVSSPLRYFQKGGG